MKRILTLAAAIVVAVILATVAVAVTAGAYTRKTTEAKVKTWHTRTVYVEERLPRWLDVHRAVEVWDNRTRLNLVLVKHCPKGKRCIRFEDGRRPGRAVASAFVWQDHDSIDRCVVVADTRKLRKLSKHQRLSTLAHETGHCLGFAHTVNSRDLMHGTNTAKRPWKPSAAHYRALARTYGR